jgi:capsular exopolysaccharide synthesis family protein
MSVIATRDQVPQLPRPGGPARPPQAQSGFSGRDLLRVLRRHKWFIVVSLAVFVVLAGAATYVWRLYAPLFQAEGLLVVNPPQSSPITRDPLPGEKVMEREVALWASLVKSRTVLDSVLKDDEVRKTDWFRRLKEKDLNEPLIRLLEDLRVMPVPDQNSIRVTLTDWKAGEVATLVQSVLNAAVMRADELSKAEKRSLLRDLELERGELTQKLTTIRGRMAAARPADIPFIQERINVLNLELQSLVKNLTDLGLLEAQMEAELNAIRAQEARVGLDKSPEVLRALDNDPTLRQMQAAKVSLLNERDNALRIFGPKHRVVYGIEARVSNIETQILDRQKELVEVQSHALKQLAESRLENVRAQLILVKEQLDEKKVGTKDLEAALARMRELADEEQSLKDRIDKLENRIMEVRVLERGFRPIVIGKNADKPLEPSMPKFSLMIPVGLVLGLLVGLGVPLLRELLSTSIKDPADVTRRTELPVLGMVPHADDLVEEIEDVRMAFSTNPGSLIGESFRQIRTCLQFSGPAEKRRVLLVASASPEDGRTTVVTNLGASLARGGKRVLIIDANFRQPMLRTLFAACPESGLSSALVGQSQWRSAVYQVEPNLSVLASGPMPPNPAELLGSDSMRQLLGEMTAEYDHVLIDGAPCLVVSDSAVLSALVDGVILVVRAGANSFGVVQRSRDMISRVGGHVLGVALNAVRVTAGGYLRKNYDQFYEYHERPQLPSSATVTKT